jgi:hypothetical protein
MYINFTCQPSLRPFIPCPVQLQTECIFIYAMLCSTLSSNCLNAKEVKEVGLMNYIVILSGLFSSNFCVFPTSHFWREVVLKLEKAIWCALRNLRSQLQNLM